MEKNPLIILCVLLAALGCAGVPTYVKRTLQAPNVRMLNFSSHEITVDFNYLPSGLTLIVSNEQPTWKGRLKKGRFFPKARVTCLGESFILTNVAVIYINNILPLNDKKLSEVAWHEILHYYWYFTAVKTSVGDFSKYLELIGHLPHNGRPHERMANAADEALSSISVIKLVGKRHRNDYTVKIATPQ